MTKKSHGGDRRPLLVRTLEDHPEELQAAEQRMSEARDGGPLGPSLVGPARAMRDAYRDLMRQRAAARVRSRRAGTQREER